MTESKKSYDAVLSWGLVEELLAGVVYNAENIVLKTKDVIPDDILSYLEGKKVLVCGSYFTHNSVAELSKRAAKVDVVVFSEKDLEKYTNTKLYQLTEGPAWGQHLLRRTRGTAAGEVPEDEAFYRGLLTAGTAANLTLEQTLRAMMADELKIGVNEALKFSKEYTGLEEELIKLGVATQRVDEVRAYENVKLTGLKFQLGKYTACIVSASVIPVMPVVVEAAKQADIGISERYNRKEDITQVTFYTLDPDRVDLSFVHKAPFEGGGRPDCKGKTFKGRVDILELCKKIEW